MTAPPFQAGDFVWCAFPERENPAQPSLSHHLAYTLAVSSTAGGAAFSVLAAYTTSQTGAYENMPLGVRVFDKIAATKLGQDRAFLIDLRRLAFVPVTRAWFPFLDQPAHGVQGRTPKSLQRDLMQTAEALLTRHNAVVEQLGPLWPRPSR